MLVLQGFQNLVGMAFVKQKNIKVKLEPLMKGGMYHIYNRGINGGAIFINDENKNYFLKLVNKYLIQECGVYAYCLMDNHFHFLLEINSDETEVTQSLSNLFNAYAKAFNKSETRTGSLFEKHFKRIRIEDETYLRQLIVYIHLNPEHHLRSDYTKFKFSSYNSILSEKSSSLKRKEILELFGGCDNFEFVHRERKVFLDEKFTFE